MLSFGIFIYFTNTSPMYKKRDSYLRCCHLDLHKEICQNFVKTFTLGTKSPYGNEISDLHKEICRNFVKTFMQGKRIPPTKKYDWEIYQNFAKTFAQRNMTKFRKDIYTGEKTPLRNFYASCSEISWNVTPPTHSTTSATATSSPQIANLSSFTARLCSKMANCKRISASQLVISYFSAIHIMHAFHILSEPLLLRFWTKSSNFRNLRVSYAKKSDSWVSNL